MNNNDVKEKIENATPEEMVDFLFSILKWFKKNQLGNPFNYNRAFEFIQAKILGFDLLPVGGGSDGISVKDPTLTAEFKGTEYQGLTKRGKEKSHSFTYNGTTRKDNIDDQEEYCYDKIMRDNYHYWSMFDYDEGILLKTIKIKNNDVWSLLWPKWRNSYYKTSNADPRIGGSVSTNELQKNIIQYEVINH